MTELIFTFTKIDERKKIDWCGLHLCLENTSSIEESVPSLSSLSTKVNVAIGFTNIAISMDGNSMIATASTLDGKSIVVKPGLAISHSGIVNHQTKDAPSLLIQAKFAEQTKRTYNLDVSIQ